MVSIFDVYETVKIQSDKHVFELTAEGPSGDSLQN